MKICQAILGEVTHSKQGLEEEEVLTFSQRISAGGVVVKEIVGKIWIYILLGIAVGAGAHGFVPDEYLAGALGNQNWYSVPLAILVGIPHYSNAAGIIIVGLIFNYVVFI